MDSLNDRETTGFWSPRVGYRRVEGLYTVPMSVRTVLLYGRSLLLSGVAASLLQGPNLRVLEAATWTEVEALLSETPPDVIVTELTAANDSRILPLLFKNPQLLVVGLDAESNQAVLVSGQEVRALTIDQIRHIAEKGD